MQKDKIGYHERLKTLMDDMAHLVYDASVSFPKDEQFGITSQIRRASISVVLNYVEGYARQRKAVMKQFIEISYGSLKETRYLIEFTYKRGYLTSSQFNKLDEMSEEIGKMLWGILRKL